MEAITMDTHWKTSLHVGSLVTLVAAVHLFFPGRPAIIGFILGLSGWGYILSEIFTGEAGQVAAGNDMNKFVASSFKTMRFIVTVGWSIYPLGYFFGYLCGSVDSDALNLVYNLADFVNKIAFCLAIWACAKSSTLETWNIDDEINALEAQKRSLQAKKSEGSFTK